MDTQILPASEAENHRPPATSHESPVTWCKLFSFTLLSKNASANHLVSHSCKNKGLKVPCFHTLTKKGVGEGGLFASEHESPITNHESPAKHSNSFRITYICKFASANPYGSHTSKTKDLKPFRITYLQKKGRVAGGRGPEFRVSIFEFRLPTLGCQLSRVSPLDSALTFFLSANPLASTLTGFTLVKSFTSNTYEKHTQGEGGLCRHQPPLPPLPPLPPPITQSRIADHAPQTAMVHSSRPLIGKRHDTV